MTAGYVIVALLALGAAWFVAAPLFRRDAGEAERVARVASEEMDLESQRGMVMAALKDLEDDRATDKIGQDDYEALHEELTARAVAILRRQDELEAEAQAVARSRAIPHPRAKSPESTA